MHRSESKKREEERKQINEISKQPLLTTLETEETLTKLLSALPYDEKDITKHAKIILEQYSYSQQFKLLTNDNFDKVFENVGIETKPTFVIFEKQKNRWVVFCLTRQGDVNLILYKDSSGGDVPSKLEDELRKHFSSMEFVVHNGREHKIDEDYNYGPFCLRNLQIMLDFLKKTPTSLVEEFSKAKFCQTSDVNRDKINNVINSTLDLSKNDNFKTALKEFINKLPLDLSSDIISYQKVLEEELEKGENVDHDKIKQARLKFLNEGNIKKLQDNYKLQKTESEGEYELEIQKNFPKEMETLRNIFTTLEKIKVDKQLFDALENISLILNIDCAKMKSFYEARLQNEENDHEEKLVPEDIDHIAENLPTVKTDPADDCTPLDKLLAEITIGMDQDDSNQKDSALQGDIHQIEAKYNLVQSKYEAWKNSTVKEIHSWARAKKDLLGTSDDEICETIAIANRAFNLLTGFSLRNTQILSVLVFFHGSSSQGRLCQIKTGEGKTVIISLLAVIRALQGWTVDVITSNPLMAADGVAETRRFYSVFNLTVSTNNPGGGDFKLGYSADVLYGTISNFQFDYLKDSFEGYNIRNGRKFGQVILDEVDSMLVDNGGHIAKLASPFPGMECLRYIYINIWEQLQKAEDSFAGEIQEKIASILKLGDKEEARLQYDKLVEEAVSQERKIIKEKIKASNPTDVCLIPQHLKEYVTEKLDVWLKNALHAKYNCHEHQQYRIMTNDTGEQVVTPVDYLNTGVTLRNTIWSNGLHQFVQLKHNLYLTFESLTSSFISNIGYIKCYDDKNIFGLTGTLGSRAEQELLSSIYNVNYAKLPTYKEKRFEELPGLIFDDSSWPVKLTLQLLEKIDEGRAVLAIFETEEDLLSIRKNLELVQTGDFRIRSFAHEENAQETEERVKVGDIILATNIAGRGTNFKTEESLEANGGLHVCVGFLPCNVRVEGQAFGRTSRQGNKGTAQLIIRRSEVDELGLTDPGFSEIKRERDALESKRLEQINNSLVKELNFKDKLFKKFSVFYTNLRKSDSSREFGFVLQDLKEFWAFWLEKKNFNIDNIQSTNEDKEFGEFVKKAGPIADGIISHNPFYCVALADCYLEDEKNQQAKNELHRAIELGGPNNFDLLAGVYLKLFEIAISEGEQIKERFKKAVANIFFIKLHKNEKYKEEAANWLNRAKGAIQKEIDYIQTHLTQDDFNAILHQNLSQNLLVKHLYSRQHCLSLHAANIDNLLDDLAKGSGLDFAGSAETTLENLASISKNPDLTQFITLCELTELHSIGLDTVYCLREIHDVPDAVIKAAQGQIIAGIAALGVGLAFLPIFPLMSNIAGTLISEGVIDIVMQLLTQGNTEFNEADFRKGKFVSYGISLLTFGVSAVTQSVRILSKAVSFCRKLSSFLRRSTYLQKVCTKLAKIVDRLGDCLEKLVTVAKFNKMTKIEQLDELLKLKGSDPKMFEKLGGVTKLGELQNVSKLKELSRCKLLVNFAKEVAWDTSKSIAKSIIKEKVVKPLISQMFEVVFDWIKHKVKKHLADSIRKNHGLVEKIRTVPKETIDDIVDEFITSDNEVTTVLKEIGFGILGEVNNTVVDVFTQTYDNAENLAKLIKCVTKFVSYLDSNLKIGDNNNDVNVVIEEICSTVGDQMASLCFDIVGSNVQWIKDHNFDKEDAYSLLGLDSDALETEVKKKFREKVLELHLDNNLDDSIVEKRFQIFKNAYAEILSKCAVTL
ncbi:uncharacterized protein LOC103314809 [Tribolium castaneum]|uniref:Protein translocase subunit SecA n=1 Tax=Tribolium castaneum TaxID=7070 RepID=D6WYB0_TRICA|nr:PREDICTED: uncharacterized protein LOC103314809 [Tribolium castaneum]EFA09123.1 hypothetical protein TcasGA2_TC015984 [Tribolium castaneum]|eukprot:XP_008199984.1 PREDICTED: uncharacterized protein LOC103314809 [Tribolium castaneum]